MKKEIVILSVLSLIIISFLSGCIYDSESETIIFEQNLYKKGDNINAPNKPQTCNVVVFTDEVFVAIGSNHPLKVFESVLGKIDVVWYFNQSTKEIIGYDFVGGRENRLIKLESNEYYFVYVSEDCILRIEG